jgi:hypothetical protein
MGSTENRYITPRRGKDLFCALDKTNAVAIGNLVLEMQP